VKYTETGCWVNTDQLQRVYRESHPRAKAGVFAVRQGPPLDHNLRAKLAAEALIPHTPQADYLALIGTGARYAVVSKRGFWPLRGRWVWFWKDWIDRRFMRQFR